MNSKKDLVKISDWLWELPKSFRKDMRVPSHIYATEKLLEKIEPEAITQVVNVATLPGIVDYSFAMPDIHTGYGFVIGGVAAMSAESGVISPGGVGYDIACSVRLLRSYLSAKEISPYIDALATEIQKEVPSGLGRGRQVKLSRTEIDKILEGGASYLVEQGYGTKEDIEYCEERGRMEGVDPTLVSDHAKQRGRDQVGTLGSGNHFMEIQVVDEIFDKEAAEAFGLLDGQIVLMIHCGSRGLGHQIATDYIKIMIRAMEKYDIKLPDRELTCAPFNSPEGQNYFAAMKAGANFSWANRHMITHYIRQAWQKILGEDARLELVYDVSHNTAKLEQGRVVHRKGATRAFPPGHPELPEKYREVGQPVLIPGSMGTASWVLVGQKEGEQAFFSSCHGAGRAMSRKEATRRVSGQKVINELKSKGILVKCFSSRGIAEEAPLAYKNVDEVVEVVKEAGLSKKVARLLPLAVIKGE
ncbi:MAG: tRNA-splicing ligase RtcB [Parcubacteria group bacterium Gr01-1014_30]|nr:MAG: tRNA-splicing ligase RtcB [Parcubacteria group bacterium Gr01-1014_30]